MNGNFDSFSNLKITSMDRIYDLQTQLIANVLELDNIIINIDKLEKDIEKNIDKLEELYKNEFMLYLDNIGIYEDLIKAIDREPKTTDNEFELKKLKRDVEALCRVETIDILGGI